MTLTDAETRTYVSILEAVVAALAVKAGLNPTMMMGKAIEQITEQANMETPETERLIRERWEGRDITAATMVAQLLPSQLTEEPLSVPEAPEPVPMSSRLQEYRQRQSEGRSDTVP